ncbi:hypothetical protein [Bosea caraganae]|nr:hypothetical protein [Bosea caraganae]
MLASTFRSLSRLGPLTGAAAFALFVQPVAAADFQIDNFKLDLGGFVITAPKIDVKGSPLEREAFVSLFNGSTGESGVARMSRFNAAQISAAEVTMEQTIGSQKQVTVYRDISLSDIREGRIGRGQSSGATIKASGGPAGAMDGVAKRMSYEMVDLRQIARVLGERATPGKDEPMVTVFGRFEQEGYAFDMGAVGKITLGRMSGRDVKARVGSAPLMELFGPILAQAEADQKALKDPSLKRDRDPEADKRTALSMFSLFDMFEYGSGEARDMAMAMTVPAPKPGDNPVSVDFKIGRIAYGEDTPAKSGLVIEGLEFNSNGVKGRTDSASYSGFSFGPALQALKELLAKPESEINPNTLDYRKFIPQLGTIRIAGQSVEVPQPIKPGQPVQPPLRVGLGTFEIKAADQFNGIPTNLALTIDKLTVPVVEGTGNPAARDLLAMGYRNLDLSARIDLGWNATSNELAIRTLSLGGAGMGQFEASGTIGNVTKDLFASDLALAQIAALGATARSVQAKLQNTGLFEKLVENEARKANRKPDEVKRQYAMMASLGLAAILGPSDGAKTLAAAVSRFVAQPGTLNVEARAKSAGGLGLADVIAIGDPTEIFDKIDLKATAQ